MEEILGSHHTNLLLYLKKDTKPTLFFTLPSPIATPHGRRCDYSPL